ncbi:Glucosaminyl phosphatidylinositol (GlcN-PI) nositol acylation protein [Neofusicoccum ribis]|uniref:GPI-anchored wall transfer protein n=1 Tax=Neofusicoccum ribis TaxID=45134 RepID=A0ABR3SY31_9PEZI
MVHDKAAKEAFVSGLLGGSVSEINLVTLVAPSALLLWSVLQARQKFFAPYTAAACATDVLLNCVAILLATTLYSYSPLLLNALLVSHAIFAAFTSAPPNTHSHPRIPSPSRSSTPTKDPLPHKPFVTAWRGAMMIITCAAILAVDFKVFPRRFAKVENWGTSLMDLGVGSFVFAAGLVSARSILKQQATGKSQTLASRLYASIRHSLPLLVLGLIRLYSVKGLDYAEHVTEYGVHWNFFFTLGFLPPFMALFESAFALLPSFAALSIILGVVYEIALDFTDLTAFIVSAPRTNLFNQNREGIFSFFGYLAIFLAGRATGMYVLPRETSAEDLSAAEGDSGRGRTSRRGTGLRKNGLKLVQESFGEIRSELSRVRFNPFRIVLSSLPQTKQLFSILKRSTFGRLVFWAAVWFSLYGFSTGYYGLNLRVSRRLANLPYFLWVSAFNCGQLALFCSIETLFFPGIYSAKTQDEENKRAKEATSRVLHAFNRNGLALFLLANLLTGLVNLTIPTLEVTQLQSMAVLLAYIGVLSGVALVLDVYNISIKL